MLNQLSVFDLIGILFFTSCEEDSDGLISFDNTPIAYTNNGS